MTRDTQCRQREVHDGYGVRGDHQNKHLKSTRSSKSSLNKEWTCLLLQEAPASITGAPSATKRTPV